MAHAAPVGIPPVEPSTIIGGAPSLSCAWPSTVFLENCTGTLIHPEIVVYAAHCGADRERVWFGEDISSGAAPTGEGFSVDTEFCMVNPEWGTLTEIGPSRAADFAFCKLAEPVLDVPIVPPAMGCETTALLPGTPVTLVGYGGTDQETFGVKFQVETVLHYIDDWGTAVIGGGGLSPCAGDSGGPAFVQLPDGTWRSFGIVSGPNFGNCGDAMWFPTIYSAVPFIEANSGIDVSACHQSHGEWSPSPVCGGFPLEPWDGAGKSWANGCAGGPGIGDNDTCGAVFDASEDLVAPGVTVTAPDDRTRFDTEAGEDTVLVPVAADASDELSGVARVELLINGGLVPGSPRFGPPYQWPINLPSGTWEIEAVAIDWAGNEAYSQSVVVGVDEDPPDPEPEPEGTTDTGTSLDSSGGELTTADDTSSSTTGELGDGTGGSSGGETAAQSSEGDGCSCRQSSPAGGAWGLLLLLGLMRRRRWVAAALPLSLMGGCGDDVPPSAETGSTTSSSEATTVVGTESIVTPVAESSSGGHDSTTGAGSGSTSVANECDAGTVDCGCLADFTCGEGLACRINTCVACEAGTLTCPCVEDAGTQAATCEAGLLCFGGLCASPQPCPFLENGVCDERRGSGLCLDGTDSFDCCAVTPDVCEERSAGGRCPEGSDPQDCESSSSSGTESGGTTSDGDTGSTDSGGTSSGSSGSSDTE
ncbi:MAG: trypsin-like serine protease [Nannocystaceae bacterium]|nr:trypsin-like serine protease [Nannocystaceae bacterium]